MATPDRQELVRNAVAFLVDPKTQSSPLAQRIQFLEAKGLSPAEIDDAFRQSSSNRSAFPQQSYGGPYAPAYGPATYGPPHTGPWDWRDYFITAVVSGVVVSGAVALARKYLVPHLRPPSATAYEQDRDALTAQFEVAEALLKEIQADTAAVKQAVDEQKEKVDKATEDVEAAVTEMREGEVKTRDEMREIREEVNNIRDMLPKMIDKNKESQNQSLAELQQELKSLKALLLSRGPSLPSAPASPLPTLATRPSIPAWQLAGINSPSPANAPSTSNASASSSSVGEKEKSKEQPNGAEQQIETL